MHIIIRAEAPPPGTSALFVLGIRRGRILLHCEGVETAVDHSYSAGDEGGGVAYEVLDGAA